MQTAIRALQAARRVLLCGHVNPDGDCIGSLCALQAGLQAAGKQADIVMADPPEVFAPLLPANGLLPPGAVDCTGYDLLCIVDCANQQRLDLPPGGFEQFDNTLCIDHHTSNGRYAGHTWLDGAMPACCMMVQQLLSALGVALTPAMADALFVGILTDTGRFSNANVTAGAFEAAGQLVQVGADAVGWQYRIFCQRSLAATQLMGRMLGRVQLAAGGRVAVGYITQQDMQQTGAGPGDHEGLVDLLRHIQGVRAAGFVRPDGAGSKASLRTVDVDANQVAGIFGGGGHIRAAGCSLELPPQQAAQAIGQALVQAIEQQKP